MQILTFTQSLEQPENAPCECRRFPSLLWHIISTLVLLQGHWWVLQLLNSCKGLKKWIKYLGIFQRFYPQDFSDGSLSVARSHLKTFVAFNKSASLQVSECHSCQAHFWDMPGGVVLATLQGGCRKEKNPSLSQKATQSKQVHLKSMSVEYW